MPQKKKTKKSPNYTSSGERVLLFGREQDIEFLNSQITLYTNGVNRSDAEANSTDRGLASQLILITTVLITANIVVFSNGELMQLLNLDQIAISLFGSNMLVISLLFGIAYYSVTKRFHATWASARADIANEIGHTNTISREYIDELVKKRTKDLSPQIKSYYLVLQITFLALALLAFVSLMTSLLLDIQFEDLPFLISSYNI